MKKALFASVMLTLCLGGQAQQPVYLNESAPMEARVKDALGRMTLHEKIKLCHAQSQFSSAGVPRLGIPQLMMSDGPHGVRAEVSWKSWGSAGWTNDSIVAFPALTCLAATWNPDMSALYGRSVGEEFAYRGKAMMLGPGLNIYRTPLGGRNFEYMGEDPYLAGEMVVPYIQGAQKNGVACCAKHFFLNDQEFHRGEVNVTADERTIHEIYLPAFKKAVQEGGVWAIMGSYNFWDGVHCCHNDSLLNRILKRDWGFDGVVVSDWGGAHDALQAATGGLDIEMGSYTNGFTKDSEFGFDDYYLGNMFEQLIRSGRVPMSVLNDKAARILRTIFRTSMSRQRAFGSICSDAHYEACRAIGDEGIVLLRNEKNILPLDASKYKHILVVGENATKSLTKGGGSSELKTLRDYSPLESLRALYGDKIDYAQGYYSGEAIYDRQKDISADSLVRMREATVAKAKQADLIIYVGGLNKNAYQDCEGVDRKEYNLSFGQDALIEALTATKVPVVAVMMSGNAYAMPWIDGLQALVQAWYLGSECGNAVADVLSGKVNPSGRLPFTFIKRLEDCPAIQLGKESYPGVNDQETYKEGIFVGYRWFDTKGIKTQFPFGFGLSYTTFRYGKATLSSPTMERGGKLTLTATVTNAGRRAGQEVVQLYIGQEKCSVPRPKKELKGFRKIMLQPGETKTVTFDITEDDLKYYDVKSHGWKADAGKYRAYVAASSADVKQVCTLELAK